MTSLEVIMQALISHEPINRQLAEESQRDLLPQLLDYMKRVQELDDGYQLFFAADDHVLKLVCDWLLVERVCNPFLRYKLTIESNRGPIGVEICGPAGTKGFLVSELALKRWLQ